MTINKVSLKHVMTSHIDSVVSLWCTGESDRTSTHTPPLRLNTKESDVMYACNMTNIHIP